MRDFYEENSKTFLGFTTTREGDSNEGPGGRRNQGN